MGLALAAAMASGLAGVALRNRPSPHQTQILREQGRPSGAQNKDLRNANRNERSRVRPLPRGHGTVSAVGGWQFGGGPLGLSLAKTNLRDSPVRKGVCVCVKEKVDTPRSIPGQPSHTGRSVVHQLCKALFTPAATGRRFWMVPVSSWRRRGWSRTNEASGRCALSDPTGGGPLCWRRAPGSMTLLGGRC